MKKEKEDIRYVIWLKTGECVTGFKHPEKERYAESNEIKIAALCHTVIGNNPPYEFMRKEQADFIAARIPESKVEQWAHEPQEQGEKEQGEE